MTDGEKIGATRLVLEPVSLAVYLARSLSPWYHEIPDVDVMGKLHAVKVSSAIDDLEAHQHVVHITLKFLSFSKESIEEFVTNGRTLQLPSQYS